MGGRGSREPTAVLGGGCLEEGHRSGRGFEDLPGGQEEAASVPPTSHSCRCFEALEDVLIGVCRPPLSLAVFPSGPQIWVRKTSDSTKMRIYLGQLQRGLFVIRRRSAA